ncbi:hypothetical protein NQK81_21280 [Amycolatopsis roodepoortensis]|uniref:hypothetical protein n=1 Tax=Amycolatopsis roodepoortensis TaxID=700274 RepID=UPI00214AB992|nr:hypothetical protein [Amycolatopsis roodepoortensis]UUV35867.1 hypothetical protein NQK81_21280 [Amycolatopsis roodepoortensis]
MFIETVVNRADTPVVHTLAAGSGSAGVWTLIAITVGLVVVLTGIGIAQARDPARRPAPPEDTAAATTSTSSPTADEAPGAPDPVDHDQQPEHRE